MSRVGLFYMIMTFLVLKRKRNPKRKKLHTLFPGPAKSNHYSAGLSSHLIFYKLCLDTFLSTYNYVLVLKNMSILDGFFYAPEHLLIDIFQLHLT